MKSQIETIKKYKEGLTMDSKVSLKYPKTGQGIRYKRKRINMKKVVDVIPYSNPDDLVHKIQTLIAAKSSGNTGLDIQIISILDELLKIEFLNKDDYDECYRNIFKK